MFACYTYCETGFRSFAHIAGVEISYDRKLIAYEVEQERSKRNIVSEQVGHMERAVAEHAASLPPAVQHAIDHNRKVVDQLQQFAKRLATAEAVLNGRLVRDLMFCDDIKTAIAYSTGSAA